MDDLKPPAPPFLTITATRVMLKRFRIERKHILEDQEGLDWWSNPVGQKVTSQPDLVRHYLFVCILITVYINSCANAADQLQEVSCV